MLGALILAAGRGSRLEPLTRYIPKAAIQLPGGSPLDYHISDLIATGVSKIFVVCKYLEKEVVSIVGQYRGCELISQRTALGTAADGILAAEKVIAEDFIVVHGDHYFSQNPFRDLIKEHIPGGITFLIETPGKYRSFGYDLRCIWDPKTKKIRQWADKGKIQSRSQMTVVDGCMVVPSGIFTLIRDARKAESCSEMRDVFGYIMQRELATVSGVETRGWWANINDVATLVAVTKRILEDRPKLPRER